MQVLWELETASVKDVIEQLPSPKPAYNTVSTIIRILENKQIVGHTTQGRGHSCSVQRGSDKRFSQRTPSLLSGAILPTGPSMAGTRN